MESADKCVCWGWRGMSNFFPVNTGMRQECLCLVTFQHLHGLEGHGRKMKGDVCRGDIKKEQMYVEEILRKNSSPQRIVKACNGHGKDMVHDV